MAQQRRRALTEAFRKPAANVHVSTRVYFKSERLTARDDDDVED